MSNRFGHDFANVRLHVEEPEVAARGAQAMTIGEDIAFAPGRYAPETMAGRTLIAHELAHVTQQARGGNSADAEARADHAADRAISGQNVHASALGGAPRAPQAKPDDSIPSPDAEPVTTGEAEPQVDIITGAGGTPATEPTLSQLDGFAVDSAKLTKRQREAIERIAFQIWMNLSRYPMAEARVAISGHTDTTGSEKHNLGLGGDRAAAARAFLEAALTRQQLDPAKPVSISTSSHGETRLRVPTADGVDEPRNRRVELEVTVHVKLLPLRPPPRSEAPSWTPLPGTPGGPPVWTLPGVLDDDKPGLGPRVPPAPQASGEWLEEALKRDPLLKKLPKWARDKAIGALKDGDEKLVDTILDKLPLDDSYKKAAKAAAKALLQTFKGRKYKPPPAPPRGIPEDMLKPPSFPKMPGEMIFKLPAIRF